MLPFAGRPLVVHALSILRAAGLSPSIAGARAPLSEYAHVIDDPTPGLGPLSGICAALAATPARLAVFLAVDLPLAPASLIAYLLHHAQITGHAVTLPSVNGFAQTFPVVLDCAVLPTLQSELENGRRGCFSAFQTAAQELGQSVAQVHVELLVQSGQIFHLKALPPGRWFLNVNSPMDLVRAEAIETSS